MPFLAWYQVPCSGSMLPNLSIGSLCLRLSGLSGYYRWQDSAFSLFLLKGTGSTNWLKTQLHGVCSSSYGWMPSFTMHKVSCSGSMLPILGMGSLCLRLAGFIWLLLLVRFSLVNMVLLTWTSSHHWVTFVIVGNYFCRAFWMSKNC